MGHVPPSSQRLPPIPVWRPPILKKFLDVFQFLILSSRLPSPFPSAPNKMDFFVTPWSLFAPFLGVSSRKLNRLHRFELGTWLNSPPSARCPRQNLSPIFPLTFGVVAPRDPPIPQWFYFFLPSGGTKCGWGPFPLTNPIPLSPFGQGGVWTWASGPRRAGRSFRNPPHSPQGGGGVSNFAGRFLTGKIPL